MRKKRYGFIFFLIPIFLLLVVFRYYPLFSAVYHSFTTWNVISSKFVGFQNYVLLFKDNLFIASLRNIFIYILVSIIIITVMAIIGAELIFNLRSKLSAFWKYLFVVPMIVPYTVFILIWKFIYNPYLGILNGSLNVIGLSSLTQPWLGSPQTALYAVAFVGFPFFSTAQFLVILSSLQNLDRSILESAKLDGATTLKRVFKIDLPLIMDKIVLIIILTIIWNFQAFTNFYLLTFGGPGSSTLVPGLYLYQMAFENNSMGYACAIGVIMAIIALILVFITQKIEQLIIK